MHIVAHHVQSRGRQYSKGGLETQKTDVTAGQKNRPKSVRQSMLVTGQFTQTRRARDVDDDSITMPRVLSRAFLDMGLVAIDSIEAFIASLICLRSSWMVVGIASCTDERTRRPEYRGAVHRLTELISDVFESE